jgi:VWFA-related protein
MNQETFFRVREPGAFGRCCGLISGYTWPRKSALAILAPLLVNYVAIAQQHSPTTLHVETRLVQVRVRVVGRDGRPVTGLTKSDFVIKENGNPQQVSILNYIPVVTPVTKAARAPRGQGPASLRAESAGGTAPRVWIYIDTEVDSTEIPQAYQALRNFLANQLEPGFMVSLDGLPFTNNQPQLLGTLEKMRQHPHGQGSDVPALVAPTMFMEKQADYQWLEYSALVYGRERLAPPPGFARRTMLPTARASDAVVNLGTTEREMAFYVRAALFRFLDIIHGLELLHGQKMVVIFRSGLRMGPDNTGLLHTFAAEAMRHRINFYTVDSRGSLNVNPSANREKAMQYGLPPQANSMTFMRGLNDYNRTKELILGRRDGLVDVAKLTAGEAVTDTNDLDTVFNDVVRDSSGFYLLGYYVTGHREGGSSRRLKITVDRPDVRVYAPRSYYEPLPYEKLSKREKEVALWRVLNDELPQGLPVAATVHVFRGSDGQPVAVLSAGVKLGSLSTKRKGKISDVHVTALAEIRTVGVGLPVYRGEDATAPIPNEALRPAQANPTVFLSYDWTLPVSPGSHICKVVLRDDYTGKLGADEVHFDAPDYGSAPATSSLLITREAHPVQTDNSPGKGQGQPAKASELLEAAGLNFAPEPDSTFLEGDEIYLFSILYNSPSYDPNALADFTRALGGEVLSAGAPIRNIDIDWRISPDAKGKVIRVVGLFNTSGLKPGNYQVIETIPTGTGQTPQKLLGAFNLLPPPNLHVTRAN